MTLICTGIYTRVEKETKLKEIDRVTNNLKYEYNSFNKRREELKSDTRIAVMIQQALFENVSNKTKADTIKARKWVSLHSKEAAKRYKPLDEILGKLSYQLDSLESAHREIENN